MMFPLNILILNSSPPPKNHPHMFLAFHQRSGHHAARGKRALWRWSIPRFMKQCPCACHGASPLKPPPILTYSRTTAKSCTSHRPSKTSQAVVNWIIICKSIKQSLTYSPCVTNFCKHSITPVKSKCLGITPTTSKSQDIIRASSG